MSGQDFESPERLEQAAFSLLVGSYPAPWSREEIIRALASDPNEFPGRDAVDNSLRELVSSGLLHQNGELFLPTRPAIRALELCD